MSRKLLVGIVIVALLAAALVVFVSPQLSRQPASVTPTTDPAIYNQVPVTTVFEPGQCTAVLNAAAPAHTSNTLGQPPSGEIPAGEYEVGIAAQYSTSLWYGLNHVTGPNYINSTNVSALRGECSLNAPK